MKDKFPRKLKKAVKNRLGWYNGVYIDTYKTKPTKWFNKALDYYHCFCDGNYFDNIRNYVYRKMKYDNFFDILEEMYRKTERDFYKKNYNKYYFINGYVYKGKYSKFKPKGRWFFKIRPEDKLIKYCDGVNKEYYVKKDNYFGWVNGEFKYDDRRVTITMEELFDFSLTPEEIWKRQFNDLED